MIMNKKLKHLEEIATKITGIPLIDDYEYQKITYSKSLKGPSKQHRGKLFKDKKRII